MDTLKLSPMRKTIVGVQFLFVAFGATVLVPLLVGLDPATALFTAGLGTFIFHLVTKGKVPIFFRFFLFLYSTNHCGVEAMGYAWDTGRHSGCISGLFCYVSLN